MNRRNFFKWVAGFLALSPLAVVAGGVIKPANKLLPDQWPLTMLLVGRPRSGKTRLVEAMVNSSHKKLIGIEMDGYPDPAWYDGFGGKRVEHAVRQRQLGKSVVMTKRLNKSAVLAHGYGASVQLCWPLTTIADWTFMLGGHGFVEQGDQRVESWRCRTILDRFGNKPMDFTFVQLDNRPFGSRPQRLELCAFETDGAFLL